jgi:hypothetical protein
VTVGEGEGVTAPVIGELDPSGLGVGVSVTKGDAVGDGETLGADEGVGLDWDDVGVSRGGVGLLLGGVGVVGVVGTSGNT